MPYPPTSGLTQAQADLLYADREGAAAYVQTYATADRTQSNPTAVVLTTFGVAANNALVDVTSIGVSDPVKVNANFDDVGDEVNKLIADLADVKQITNSIIDDIQAAGIAQ